MQTFDLNIWTNELHHEHPDGKTKLLLESQQDILNYSWKILSKHSTRNYSKYGVNMNLDNSIERKIFEELEKKFCVPSDLEQEKINTHFE